MITITYFKHVIAVIVICWVALHAEIVPAAENYVPFEAVVRVKNGLLRSGPGEQYYPTRLLEQGERLEVYLDVNNDWFGVRPPEGSFTWVDARAVKLQPNGTVGTIVYDRVPARVGSELGNMCGAINLWLNRGDRVAIYERVETPMDQETPVWYKIAPPAGEFRWVRKDSLSFNPSQLVSDVPKPLYAYPRTDSLKPKKSPIIQASGTQPEPDAVIELSMEDFRLVLNDLKLEFSNLVISEDDTDRNQKLESLAHEARVLYEAAPTAIEEEEINRFLAAIEKTRHQHPQTKANYQPILLEERAALPRQVATPVTENGYYSDNGMNEVYYYDPNTVTTSPYPMQYALHSGQPGQSGQLGQQHYYNYYTHQGMPQQVPTLSNAPPQSKKKSSLFGFLKGWTSQPNIAQNNPPNMTGEMYDYDYRQYPMQEYSLYGDFSPEMMSPEMMAVTPEVYEQYMMATPQMAMSQREMYIPSSQLSQFQSQMVPMQQQVPMRKSTDRVAGTPRRTVPGTIPVQVSPGTPTQTAKTAQIAQAPVYDVIGKLGRVPNPQKGMPAYGIEDENGKTYYVTPPPGTDLNALVGENKLVGISGTRGIMQDSGIPHISAKTVHLLKTDTVIR